MPTRQEVKASIKPRLRDRWINDVAWADVVQAFGGSTSVDRTDVVSAIRDRDNKQLGAVFRRVMNRWADTKADTEADTILSDDSFSYDELERVYGDIF